jgi:O-antigen ligase
MKHLLLFFAVLVPFVPDLGQVGRTSALGQVTFADKLLVPGFVALAIIARKLPPTPMERHARALLAFIVIALIASVTVPLRFPAADPSVAVMGVLRIAKFSGYALLAFASLRCFASPLYRRTVVAGWGLGVVLLSSVLVYQAQLLDQGLPGQRQANLLHGNPVSVALACVVVSSTYVLTSGRLAGARAWMLAAVTFSGVVGMIFSQGRGGWLSLVLGAAFMTRRIRLRFIAAAAVVGLIVAVAASNSPSVARNLQKLVVEEKDYSVTGDDAESSVDDGGRIQTWVHESGKLAEHPLLGFGIFHRGGASPLWSTGSHNFFLQMFLEAGLLGGCAFLWFFWSLWRATQTLQREARIGGQAVLITMGFGAMGGEYLYGDAPLYCFLIALWMLTIPAEVGTVAVAPTPVPSGRRRRSGQPRRSESANSARSGMPASASASAPPSPRSTTQSAPST